MKLSIYNSRYFIAIGILILLCFSGIGFYMTSQFSKGTKLISIDMATQAFRLKSTIIKNEFNGFVKGVNDVETILPQLRSKQDFYKAERVVGALLLSHPKIHTGWYALAEGRDTVYRMLRKTGQVYTQHPPLAYQQEWMKKQLLLKDSLNDRGTLINVKDSLHWLPAAKQQLADASTIVFGIDINLKELQDYWYSVDSSARAYAFIVDPEGYYITNQEESLIGKQAPLPLRGNGIKIIADSISSYEITNSSYLEVPVFRFYTPIEIGPMKWTMVVDTPVFTVDEDVRAIERAVFVMFISTALIVLFLIAFAQSRWQKEFMLRQQAELKRQELSLEKQALSLTAERQQKENALLQLDKLKEKIDPHFLFNSLSSLNGLIEEQPELAKSFVVKLSRVYRYVLDPSPNGLEKLSKEILFAKEYFFLLKIRFGDALGSLEVDVNEEHNQTYLPFMSVQTLVENAVKHNVVSKLKPLHIRIQSAGNGIVVTNNLQPRNDVKDSGKQGLNYLQQVYAHFGDYAIRHGIENGNYRCFLPVIKDVFTP